MKFGCCSTGLLWLLLWVAPEAARAQDVVTDTAVPSVPVRFSTGVIPDTVTVGDRFQALLRVSAPRGSRVTFGPTPEQANALQATDSVRLIVRSGGEQTAVYPLVAWQVAPLQTARVPVQVLLADGRELTFQVSLRMPAIRSVLPADTAGVEPRGAKDVAGGWDLRLIAAIAAAVASVLALTWLLWRRTRRVPAPVPAPIVDPRHEALAALVRAEALRAGEPKPFFAAVSHALRHYLATLSPAWGADLTTEELVGRLRASGLSSADVEQLHALLREADLVKFARARPSRGEMERVLMAARGWIEHFSPRHPDAAPEREVA